MQVLAAEKQVDSKKEKGWDLSDVLTEPEPKEKQVVKKQEDEI